ncbi:hypothetical protein JVU11DRAFT_4256 [Chiua virens]|nr:hypothetical protein JVU11DRAFT_4256 [Chiua virens]
MKTLLCLAVILLLSVFAHAQTETAVNAAGATVVEVLSVNPLNGLATTVILQTITGATTSKTALTTASTTSNLLQTTALATTTVPQGPVGQPASEPATPGGPTPYEYTTTDANGNTVVQQGVFTPTTPGTVLPVPTTTGSVLGYSQWLSMVGTYTVPANAAHRTSISVAAGWYYFAATAFAGLAGGVWLIIL